MVAVKEKNNNNTKLEVAIKNLRFVMAMSAIENFIATGCYDLASPFIM